MSPTTKADWPPLSAANFIDEQTFARLRELQIVPSSLATDEVFLRRLSLTTIGQLPTAAEMESFLADAGSDKRTRKIDERLGHKLHAALWATRVSEMTGNSIETLEGPDELKPKRAKMWHDWLRRRFEHNAPYDQIVRRILTATSRDGRDIDEWIDVEAGLIHAARKGFDAEYADRPSLDLFWRRDAGMSPYPIEEIAERVASSFMGVRINCARCHKHPFDRWTQQDYGSFVSIFASVRFDMSPALRAKMSQRLEARRLRAAEGEDVGPPLPQLREVYVADHPRVLRDAETRDPLAPKALGGPRCVPASDVATPAAKASYDARVALMDWLTEPQNPYFARNIVNRVWAHHFGRGLVEPLDGFSAENPPSHPQLLDELAADFIKNGYDIRRLERLILTSTTWQLSSEPNETNQADKLHFARAYVRLPPSEAIVDMWHAATGIAPDFGDSVPDNVVHAVEIGPNQLGDNRWNRFLTLFGRSMRTQTCDCAPRQTPSIRQTLALMSDPNLLTDLSAGRLKKLIDAGMSDDEIIEQLFLGTLSRRPTENELVAGHQALRAGANRNEVFEDILWGLLNTQEFITNH